MSYLDNNWEGVFCKYIITGRTPTKILMRIKDNVQGININKSIAIGTLIIGIDATKEVTKKYAKAPTKVDLMLIIKICSA